MTKQTKIDSKLESYLTEIKEQLKPDPVVLQAMIDDAKDRHLPYIEASDHGHLLMVKLQEKILQGYRYELSQFSYHGSGSGFIRIRLNKPDEILNQELSEIEAQVTARYHASLESQIEQKINELMKQAADEAVRAAEAAAAAEQEQMKLKLKQFLLS